MSETVFKYALSFSSSAVAQPPYELDYARLEDGQYAQLFQPKAPSTASSLWSNFGFSSVIPDGSTIKGIEVRIRRWTSYSTVHDTSLKLYLNGSLIGSEYASASYWSATPIEEVFGGPTDMWGTTLTRANIIDSTFGVHNVIVGHTDNYAAPCMDYLKIKVYYTEPRTFTVGNVIRYVKVIS